MTSTDRPDDRESTLALLREELERMRERTASHPHDIAILERRLADARAESRTSSANNERLASTLRELPLLSMPRRHAVMIADVNRQHLEKILLKTYERAPENFETLLGMEGVGAKTLRALALASEVIYGTPASTRDPARFSFAVGGKDGFPYPVDLETYDKTVEVLRAAVNKANIDRSERVKALKRLVDYGAEKVRKRMDAGKEPI